MSSRLLRFLFITADEFPPKRPDVASLFAKELLRRGHRIDWIMRSAAVDGPTGCLEWQGCKVWVAPTSHGRGRWDRLRKHLYGLRNDLRVFSLVRRNRYDFIQVKDKFLAAIMALIASRLHGVKFFFWLSFPYPEAYLLRARSPGANYRIFSLIRGTFFTIILYQLIARFAAHIFVQSEEMKRRMAQRGIAPERMTAIPMGVDLDGLRELDGPRVEDDTQGPTILYLGSLERMRGLDLLLDAFSLTLEACPGARLLLVGDGPEPEDRIFLSSRAAHLGILERVTFTGFLPRDRALDHVRRSAVCVSVMRPQPIYDVASPTKVLEYMALARPVVATDQPDQRQVLQESGAGICTSYEATAIADALTWMLRHPEQARLMGMKGREYVERTRNYRAIASDLEGHYARQVA